MHHMGHFMAGGLLGFMLHRILRGLIMKLMILAAIGAAIFFFLKWQQERQRNRLPPGWE